MAGQITWTISHGFRSTTNASLSGSYIQVGSAEQSVNTTFAAAGSGVASAATFALPGTSSGDLVAIEILSNQPCTIQTNSTSSPGNTITLAANIPLMWDSLSGLACPFTVAVTEFFVTNTNALNLRYNILTF